MKSARFRPVYRTSTAIPLQTVVAILLFICLIAPPLNAQEVQPGVTLTETTVTWQTVAHTVGDDYAIVPGSLDASATVTQTFDAYILENAYIRATLVPEYGGRILSLIDKITGHEQLYQNPLGLPYGIGEGNFYYDWLMVYGGIFPTFPAPEHGKTWFLPWTFEINEETPDRIAVRMTVVDDITSTVSPSRFNANPTGLEAEFVVALAAGHRALDTSVTLHNPTERSVRYEYWTCVTLAPGSEIGDPRATANTEIIAPVTEIKMPPWWPQTTAQEEPTAVADVYTFDRLRLFANWADMGIAYAYPTMSGANFWGAINHDNGEGLIRIADNALTPGMKIWTWGSDSLNVEAAQYATDERRPYIELWAGVTPEFFTTTTLDAGDEITITARYALSAGLRDVTHASPDALAHFYRDESDTVRLHIAAMQPQEMLRVVILADDAILYEQAPMTGEALAAAEIAVQITQAETVAFQLIGDDDTIILEGDLP